MDIYVADEQDLPLPVAPLRELVRLVLEAEHLPPETEVGITFVTDETMARHNRRFLGGEGPTDVLALPLVSQGDQRRIATRNATGGEPVPYGLGDVFVAPRFVHRQARSLGVDGEEDMFLMVTHGLLHLLGYDHEEDAEAEAMESRERVLLARVGIDRR